MKIIALSLTLALGSISLASALILPAGSEGNVKGSKLSEALTAEVQKLTNASADDMSVLITRDVAKIEKLLANPGLSEAEKTKELQLILDVAFLRSMHCALDSKKCES